MTEATPNAAEGLTDEELDERIAELQKRGSEQAAARAAAMDRWWRIEWGVKFGAVVLAGLLFFLGVAPLIALAVFAGGSLLVDACRDRALRSLAEALEETRLGLNEHRIEAARRAQERAERESERLVATEVQLWRARDDGQRELIAPEFGDGTAAVRLTEWHVEPGQQVSQGQPIARVLYDFAELALSAPGPCVVDEVLVPSGAEVPPRTALCIVSDV